MTANAETKILPNAQLAQLPGRVCSAMPSSGDGTAQPASSFRLQPNKHILKACLGALRPPRWGESGARGDGAF